ncbi:DUF1565 domain-containing protein [Microbacterium sp. ZW T2_14]|uniref:right-handed parallel beta-helix repeat-containing protein n=1 Tax=Microbacterium sp. ZW T2_14 TaxID=3378079 RepID=UPI003854CDA4
MLAVLDGMVGEHSHKFFVSPAGSDSNPGSKGAPFKTLLRAQEAASAGDVVYIRGGVYDEFEITETDNVHEDVYHYVNPISKSDITYMAYPGDSRPVFDFSNVPTDQRVAGFYIETDVTDVNFVGFDVTGVKVGAQKQSEAFRIAGGANFVNMAAYGNEANGFYYTLEGTGAVIDSDAYDNVGPTATAASNTDGFGAHAKNVWYIDSRAWNNSDDGFDSVSSAGRVAYVGSWSFDHHGNQDHIGDQNGFKVGGYAYRTTGLPDPIPLHTVIDSLSVDNGGNNFYANHQPGQAAYWINNTATDPGYGSNYNMLERVSPASPDNIAGFREVLHGNLAYEGLTTSNNDTAPENETNNSWTIGEGLSFTDDDFVSVDRTQLTAPRQLDGGLPEVDYLEPVDGSAAAEHGLGYLANEDAPFATLSELVTAYTQSGDISSGVLTDALQSELQRHRTSQFVKIVNTAANDQISDYAVDTLTLVAAALT